MRPSKRLNILLLALVTMASVNAHAAREWRAGLAAGFGGAGINKVTANGPVDRAEGPAVVQAFADRLVRDDLSFGLEHVRGLGLGPASSGASFTGFTTRWYFLGPAPSVVPSGDGSSTLLIKRYTPFAGGAVGLAQAQISREADRVDVVSGGGVYFGVKLGFDYAIAPGMGIRPEFHISSTLTGSDVYPATLSEYALSCGLYFLF